MDNPHICIITVGFGFGGAERLIFDLVSNIKEYRFSVIGLKGDGILKEKLEKSGIAVYTLGGTNTFDFRVFPRLLTLLKRLKPDLIHTHLIKANWLGRIAGRTLNIPVISSIHTIYTFMNPLERFIENLTARLSINISCSNTVQNTNKKLIGNFYNNYINNGVDVNVDLSYPSLNLLNLVTISRISTKEKRLDILLKAFYKLSKEFPKLYLTIVGEGKYKNKFEEFAKYLGINQRVTFTGYLPVSSDFLKNFGIFILVSEFEGLPYSLLEAMASGLVPVVSSVGGIRDVVIDGVNGLLLYKNSPEEVYDKIKYLLTNKDKAEEIKIHARETIINNFHIKKTIKAWKSLYEKTLTAKHNHLKINRLNIFNPTHSNIVE